MNRQGEKRQGGIYSKCDPEWAIMYLSWIQQIFISWYFSKFSTEVTPKSVAGKLEPNKRQFWGQQKLPGGRLKPLWTLCVMSAGPEGFIPSRKVWRMYNRVFTPSPKHCHVAISTIFHLLKGSCKNPHTEFSHPCQARPGLRYVRAEEQVLRATPRPSKPSLFPQGAWISFVANGDWMLGPEIQALTCIVLFPSLQLSLW